MVQEMSSKDGCLKIFLIYSSGGHFVQCIRTICSILVGHYEECFCEIILNLNQWFRRCHLKYSYLQLWWPFCSAKQNHLCNFSRGHYGEHSCEIILTLEEMSFRENLWTDG